jgi:hypothetical protein
LYPGGFQTIAFITFNSCRYARAEAKVREKARGTTIATATDEIYEQHVAAFERLKVAAPGSLREVDIPWPQPHNLAFFTPRGGGCAS